MRGVAVLLLVLLMGAHPATDELKNTIVDDDEWTETEKKVQDIISGDGVYVVHFWAPWCHNSKAEMRSGWWTDLVNNNEDVTFVFVTVYNNGKLGEKTLNRFDIPDRVIKLAQPDRGSSNIKSNRRRLFMDLPLTWTPTTWIFNRGGKLAFAVNYGEGTEDLFQTFLDNTQVNWSH